MIHFFDYCGYTSYMKGVIVESVIIGAPVPRKSEITIPFRSSVIDMEAVVGYPVFDDRTITAKFWCRVSGDIELKSKQTEVERWLLKQGIKSDFKDSDEKEYTYRAYCSGVDFTESTTTFMKCTATFKASPYKIKDSTGEEVL